jgi:hypothetical protein
MLCVGDAAEDWEDDMTEQHRYAGHEVQKQASHDSSFVDAMYEIVDAMYEIVEAMSEEECQKICSMQDDRPTFLKKMEELSTLANDHCVFEGLWDVIARLSRDEDSDDEEEENGEEDEEEDEEEEEDVQEVEDPGIQTSGRDPGFANDEDEMLFLQCFDSGGAPNETSGARRS